MTGALKILRIEIDGHFHGSSDVPRPWVAQIDGIDPKFGLARIFVDRLNDYRTARRAHSGNMYGMVAAFPLHEGKIYEVSRLRGSSSKRHVAREFWRVADGRMQALGALEALSLAEPYAGPTVEYVVTDGTRVARVDGLGTPATCGFVLVETARLYRLRVGAIHEIDTGTERRLVVARERGVDQISQSVALAHLIATT